ncbi:MAG TPA: Wzz/FepE/Etk N-terminal domain-containing protein [Gemmatimonadaceae bacterium]|nr:Wzz/FepE/Etk N-terminal domain-containing protein [Gemmatimonadaceae bacterium]
MTAADEEVSIFGLGSSLLRHRWSIVRWMAIGGAIALVVVLLDKPSYTSSSSFMPQSGQDANRSELASLAGQFGIQIGSAESKGNSPDFYADVLKSRVILGPIVADTFTVRETGQAGAPLLDLLEVKGTPPALRFEYGLTKLSGKVGTMIEQKTGVVQLSVSTPWPSLSLAINQRLLAAVNAFNLRTRQTEASSERQFTETRLAESRDTLRNAEDRLQTFLQRNRQITGSPELRFDQDRLEREVALDQQIVMSLAQAYEEVRIREVRNTPVVTVIAPPSLPIIANARHRALRLILGLLVGALIGSALAVIRDLSRRHRAAGDPEAEMFFRILGDARGDAAKLVPRWRRRRA